MIDSRFSSPVLSCLVSALLLPACADSGRPGASDDAASLGDELSTDTSSEDDGGPTGSDGTEPTTSTSTSTSDDGPLMDMGPPPDMGPEPPEDPPMVVEPCGPASCWSTLSFSAYCGPTLVQENFSSGNYNVHSFALSVWADRPVELTLMPTAGAWFPAIVIHDEQGETVYDGVVGAWNEALTVNGISTGEDGDAAAVEILPKLDGELTIYVTGWDVIAGDFVPDMPTDVSYDFEVFNDCPPEAGTVPPPNFDPNDVVDGYHLLPDSEPPGLYTHKEDDCSRGNQNLVETIYTVAARWAELRPEYTPLYIADLNEAWCSSVDHATHDDGTHVDLSMGCATQAACANWIPALDLARLFVDTGQACGIIFNDTLVQSHANPYFEGSFAYEPWKQTFMRSVDGHDSHFHVRVKLADDSCN